MLISILLAGVVAGGCTAVRWYLDRPDRRDSAYAGGRVHLTALRNHGSAFGVLRLGSRALSALSAAVLAMSLSACRYSRLGCGLLLGGGLSNLWERVRHSSVYDYVHFPKAPGKLRQYVYNLADFAILLGALCILRGERKSRR